MRGGRGRAEGRRHTNEKTNLTCLIPGSLKILAVTSCCDTCRAIVISLFPPHGQCCTSLLMISLICIPVFQQCWRSRGARKVDKHNAQIRFNQTRPEFVKFCCFQLTDVFLFQDVFRPAVESKLFIMRVVRLEWHMHCFTSGYRWSVRRFA